MTDYKLLSKELYETLKEVVDFIDYDEIPPTLSQKIEYIIKIYETQVVRGTGRTTALYHKCITEALENPGKKVEFQDHTPMDFANALSHQNNLRIIISKLGYDIEVTIQHSMHNVHNKVILINKFGL